MEGIKYNVYPREEVIHTFRVPLVILKDRKETNLGDELLLVDLENFQINNL